MALDLKRRRFTVAEYHQMAEASILREDDRVELVDGETIEMTPIGPRHAGHVNRLAGLFYHACSDLAIPAVQNPVRLGERSEPRPDLALLRRKPDYYASGHPTPADVLLLVEVAETSADPDRRAKMPLYARSGVQEAWLVDLQQETATVYRHPFAGGYRTARVLRRGGQVSPIAFPDRAISVADILFE